MSQEGIRIIVMLVALFVAAFAIIIFIQDSALTPLGSGSAVAFTLSPSDSPAQEGGGGEDAGGNAPSQQGGSGAGEGSESSGEDAGGPGSLTNADIPTSDGSTNQPDTGSGGGGGGGSGRRTSSEPMDEEEGSSGETPVVPPVERTSEEITPSFPSTFESEDDFVESFVLVAETTIARDFGMKSAEVREIIRGEDENIKEVVVEGVSEGYLFGFIPVRFPQTIVVGHLDDQAYVRKVSRPWWAWLVRFTIQ